MKNLIKLFAIWIISLIVLCLSVTVFVKNGVSDIGNLAATFIIFMFYSVIFSLPAFLFFSICGIIILRTQLELKQKKALLLLINYTDIFGTGLAYLLLAMSNSGSPNEHFVQEIIKAFTTFYPGWMLILGSTLAILLMPFHEKTN